MGEFRDLQRGKDPQKIIVTLKNGNQVFANQIGDLRFVDAINSEV